MATAVAPITKQERAKRLEIYRNALASLRLEGLEPDDQTKAFYQRYVDGELTLAEVGAAIDELNAREFGPVSLPRNERP